VTVGQPGEVWQELGIAPTSDAREIRRAYAKRLRLIDTDRDIAAFQRLRQAFEAALAQTQTQTQTQEKSVPPPIEEAAWPDVEAPTAAPAGSGAAVDSFEMRAHSVSEDARERAGDTRPEPGSSARAADVPHDDLQRMTVRARIHLALREGDVETAFAALREALSAGFLPPTDAPEIAHVMAAAVDDRSLPGDRFRLMAEQLGWSRPTFGVGNADLHEKVVERYEAEVWFDRLAQLAASSRSNSWSDFWSESWSDSWADHHRRWLARLLLGGASGWRLYFIFTGYLRTQLDAYDRFAPWLEHRIDRRRLAWLRSRLPSRWSRLWLVAAKGEANDILISLSAFALDLGWQRKDKWGINLEAVACPFCGTPLPLKRLPRNLRQALWGGWTCARCGNEVDKHGHPVRR
jgi:hypothetical protein